MEETKNNKILERESNSINVEIEPEPIYLISKDSNNRIEVDRSETQPKVVAANGGTLAARKGPTPDRSLAHPAIIDWALGEYLQAATDGSQSFTLSSDFDEDFGRYLLTQKANDAFKDKTELLRMFQNVIANSDGSHRYIYGVKPETKSGITILQHYNRVFIMKDGTPNTYNLYVATLRKITPAMKKKRKQEPPNVSHDDGNALRVLHAQGISRTDFDDCDATITKPTNIDTEWSMYIENRSLYDLSEDEINKIVDNLNINAYLKLLKDCFNDNWKNAV